MWRKEAVGPLATHERVVARLQMTSDGPGGTVARAALRAATEATHLALHAHPRFAGLVEGTASRAAHIALLNSLWRFYARADAEIADAPVYAAAEGYRYRPRSPALEAAGARAGVPAQAPLLPVIAGLPELAGIAYVLDGALMGGAVIEAALRRQGLDIAERSFWLWCREEGPAAWAEARALIARADALSAGRAGMVAAAVASFAAFADNLDTAPLPADDW